VEPPLTVALSLADVPGTTFPPLGPAVVATVAGCDETMKHSEAAELSVAAA
jgi:hypothetical protein